MLQVIPAAPAARLGNEKAEVPGGNPGSASSAERNGPQVVVQSETSWLQWLAIRVTVMSRSKMLCSRAAHPVAGSDTNTVNR